MIKLLIALVVVSVAITGFLIGRNSVAQPDLIKRTADPKPISPTLLETLKKEKVKRVVVWDQDGDEFTGIVRHTKEFSSGASLLRSSNSLIIYNKKGQSVYALRDMSIDDVDFTRVKPGSFPFQVVVETNGGGTDNFLVILENVNGKFVEIVSSPEIQIRGGWWTMLQYRSGMKTPYFKPGQLIAIQQGGGADKDPPASVFRYEGGKFGKVGSISMMELGDSIEKQLRKSKRD